MLHFSGRFSYIEQSLEFISKYMHIPSPLSKSLYNSDILRFMQHNPQQSHLNPDIFFIVHPTKTKKHHRTVACNAVLKNLQLANILQSLKLCVTYFHMLCPIKVSYMIIISKYISFVKCLINVSKQYIYSAQTLLEINGNTVNAVLFVLHNINYI